MSSAVHVHLQLRIVGDDGTVFTDSEILRLEKSDHQLEAVGLSISDSKSLQRCLQQQVVTAQAAAFVSRHRCCPACGRHLCRKGKYPIVFRTVFGNVTLSSPRFYRCGCQPADNRTFSPLTELFTEYTAPELLYLESRWASLISFGMTATLLRDVLPVADTTNPETVRCHLHKVATVRTPTSAPASRTPGMTVALLTSHRRWREKQLSSGSTVATSTTGTINSRSSKWALVGLRGDGERAQTTSASIKEPSKAFPRLRAL
jgi:hypothetical protein